MSLRAIDGFFTLLGSWARGLGKLRLFWMDRDLDYAVFVY